MAKQLCYQCEKELGRFSMKWEIKNYEKAKATIPDGMTKNDAVCYDCFKKVQEEIGEIENAEGKEKLAESKEQYAQRKQEYQELDSKAKEYKKQWDKNGIIQFKNEQIAILQRRWGSQVQFIVAFDEITKEGYRLMAIDEGKEGSASGLTGGINAYFYFQKMEFVR